MRVSVTRWSRLETRGQCIAFKANCVEVYLTAEEVMRYDAQEHTQANGTGFFRLLLDAYTDMRYLTAAKTLLPHALRNDIQTETCRLEADKTQADGTGEGRK